MVMDATQPQQPSPESVGREFVRQYYTLLNKAPNHLHRFYNNQSSFIHGESSLVVGQKNIHNRIQQLNFHDCHAKISQVDAQATLGNGVVVQVTGELSNDGQPMRRFTQTFVLAAQSPKKYYVHNDIFRYQDVYLDEENDGESRSENDEEHEQSLSVTPGVVASGAEQSIQLPGGAVIADQQPQQAQQQLTATVVTAGAAVLPQQQAQTNAPPQQTIFYSLPAAGGRPVTVLAPAPQRTAVPLGAQFAAAGAAGVPQQQVPAVTGAGVTQLNGVVAHEDLLSGMQQAGAGQQPLVPQTGSPVLPPTAGVPVAAAVLAAQAPTGLGAIPITAALPQAVAPVIPAFQQKALLKQHQQQLLEEQQQQLLEDQQMLANTPSPQALLQSQAPQAVNVELEETISSNTVTISTGANSEHVPRGGSNAIPPAEPAAGALVVDDFKTINEQQQQEKYEAAKQQQQQQNEPKTYANLFKSTSSSPSGFVNAAMQQQQQLQQQQSTNTVYQSSSTITSSTFSQSDSTTSSMSVYSTRNNDNNSLRMDNMGGQGGPLPQRNNATRMNKDFEPRRTSNTQQFGDNQQLFLGNIPHHASEEELRSLFGRFGTVLELRILSKPPGKLPPGMRNPLNYGFLTYEDPDSVQNCLENCPLYFPENAPDGQKLNVEEKKPRMRTDMPPRQSMGGSMGGNNMNNTQRNNMGGPPRSLSNSGGGMMRGNNTGMSRGGASGGPRIGGAFNRNENRGGPTNGGGGPQVRGGTNNAQSGGGNYGGRR